MVSTRRQASVEPTNSVDSPQVSLPRSTRSRGAASQLPPPAAAPTPTSKGCRLKQVSEEKPEGEATEEQQPSGSGSDRASKPSTRSTRRKPAASPLPTVQEATSPAELHAEQRPSAAAVGDADANAMGVNDAEVHAAEELTPVTQEQQQERYHAQLVAAEPETSSSLGSDLSDSDDDGDSGLLGGPLSLLAESLRAAFSARVGHTNCVNVASAGHDGEQLSQQHKQPADVGGSSDAAGSLQWRHSVTAPKLKKHQRAAGPVAVEKEPDLAKKLVAPPRDPHIAAKAAAKSVPDTAGKQWFNLPATPITDDVKLQLRLLHLRGAYDPKRFYKSFDTTKFPKYFQIGTVLDNPTDFYSSRMARKERGEDLAGELLKDETIKHSRKRRFNKLQEQAQAYQRVKKRKTGLLRVNKRKPSPKH